MDEHERDAGDVPAVTQPAPVGQQDAHGDVVDATRGDELVGPAQVRGDRRVVGRSGRVLGQPEVGAPLGGGFRDALVQEQRERPDIGRDPEPGGELDGQAPRRWAIRLRMVRRWRWSIS